MKPLPSLLRRAARVATVVAPALLAACMSVRHHPAARPASTVAGADLGTLEIIVAPPATSLVVEHAPVSALQAATVGTVATPLVLGSELAIYGGTMGAAAGVAIAPVCAVVGGVGGAATAVPKQERVAAVAAMDRAKRELRFETSFRAALTAALLPATIPATAGTADAPRRADTALNVAVKDLRLQGSGLGNPRLILHVAIEARLVRSKDNTDAGCLFAEYKGQPRKYTEWTKTDAQLLREEALVAGHILAAQIKSWIDAGAAPAPYTPSSSTIVNL